ncbi:histidine kinase [uncultured Maribacter sp.]|uniref:histidine kinase n=1 Tax=uncultured Maribacter sp. TaxID=431308 RepID=UPI00262A79ED|nr:histidine kinase [uncultured Maribacter sp.]
METIRILAIDDHEMTPLGYKYILEGTEFEDFEVKVDVARGFELGKSKIETSGRSSIHYDIILLDIQLFPTHLHDERSGEDLGKLARQVSPDSKVVFMSSFSDSYKINSVFKTVDPDGYMVKSEIDEKSLIAMVETVVANPPYYTAGALAAVRRKMANDIVIDEVDKKILFNLSIGVRTKDIAPLISAAITTVESRKRQLKTLFGIDSGNDLALIEEARKRGFI